MIFADSLRKLPGEIVSLARIRAKIEQLGSAGIQFVNKLPVAIPQTEEPERVIGKKQSHPSFWLE